MRDEHQKEERVVASDSLVLLAWRSMKRYSTFVVVPFCAALLFIALNARYFSTQMSFFINPPKDIVMNDVTENVTYGDPNHVSIPRLGIDAPLRYVDQIDESVFQDALTEGVVHYPGTALPGEYGNVYIFGHSSDLTWKHNQYATVFALLPQIKPGDQIVVTGDDGAEYTYIAQDTAIVNPSDVGVLSQFDYQKKMLTLQTSYPLGTALQRFVVTAILQE